jgi:hypothetical protein
MGDALVTVEPEETAEESEGVIPPATEAEREYAQRYNRERKKEVRK